MSQRRFGELGIASQGLGYDGLLMARLVRMRLGRHVMVRQRSLMHRLRRHTLLNHGLLCQRLGVRGPMRAHRLSSQGLGGKDARRRDRLLMVWRNVRARRHALVCLMSHGLRASSLRRGWTTRRRRCTCRLLRRRGIRKGRCRWSPWSRVRHLRDSVNGTEEEKKERRKEIGR